MLTSRSCIRAALFVLVAGAPATAHAAEWIIKHPGDQPTYVFEAEPHGLVGLSGPFEDKGRFGAGFRGTVVIVRDGFIPKINDSVGITFGGDFFFGKESTLFLPVAMQWNFWLTPSWSVFGEPGIGLAAKKLEFKKDVLHPILMAGARFHFTERVALTLRAGYPAVSVGVSFLF